MRHQQAHHRSSSNYSGRRCNSFSRTDTTQCRAQIEGRNVVCYLNKNLTHEFKFVTQCQVLSALGCIAKHSSELAEAIIESQVFPQAFHHVIYPDESIAKAAAVLIRETCKHSLKVSL